MYQAADSTQECGERQYRASSVSESNETKFLRPPRIPRRNFCKQLSAAVLNDAFDVTPEDV